jgi:hypothetical protein
MGGGEICSVRKSPFYRRASAVCSLILGMVTNMRMKSRCRLTPVLLKIDFTFA